MLFYCVIVCRSLRNTIATENSYGRQKQPSDHDVTQQLPVYATPFSRHQTDYETPVCSKTPLDYQTPVSVRNKPSSPDTQHYYSTVDPQHYYSTAEVGTDDGCEGYSEPAHPTNTDGLLNPVYVIKSAVQINGGDCCNDQ